MSQRALQHNLSASTQGYTPLAGVLQRKCACGKNAGLSGECSSCAKENLLGENTSLIQPKLKVGAPNDKYEQEADRVADQVMRMPNTTMQRELLVDQQKNQNLLQAKFAIHDVGSRIQRQVESEEEEEVIQTKTWVHGVDPRVQRQTGSEDDEEEIQTKRSNDNAQPSGVVPNTEFSSALQSEKGSGSPMGGSIQQFMESRMGVDLSGVRIHAGPRADTLASSIQARAFTLGNDVYFASGQYEPGSSSGRRLLAHELVHTLQQNKGKQKTAAVSPPVSATDIADSSIQREVAVYWAPDRLSTGKATGAAIQDAIFADATQGVNIEQEVIIPNAARSAAGGGVHGLEVKSGRADLYHAESDKRIGVRFDVDGVPHGINTRSSGRRPRVKKGKIEKISEGPTKVKLGEIKPASREQVNWGKEQLEAYKSGIELARLGTNAWASKNAVGETWNLQSVGWLGASEFSPGQNYKFNKASPSKEYNLVLREFGANEKKSAPVVLNPAKDLGFEVKGGLYVNDYKDGIWAYYSRPADPGELVDPKKLKGKETPSVVNLAQKLQNDVVDKITGAPIQPMRTNVRNAGKHAANSRLTGDTTLQRKVAEAPRVRDTFKAQTVFNARSSLERKFEGKKDTKSFKYFRFLGLAYDAEKNLDSLGLPGKGGLPPKSKHNIELTSKRGDKTKKVVRSASDIYDWVDLWTDRKINKLARFRQRFGQTFVKVSNKVRAIKERIKTSINEKFGKRTGSRASGGGYGALAVRALGKGLKAIAKLVVPKTLRLLVNALVKGLKERIRKIIPIKVDEIRGAIEGDFKEYVSLGDRLTEYKEDFETKITAVIDGFKERLAGFDEILGLASKVGSIVKWGVRAVQCGTPPLWGCIKLVFSQLTSYVAEKVLSYCPVQKKVNRLLLGLGFIENLPSTIAGEIAGSLNGQVGEIDPRLSPAFANIEGNALPDTSEIGCEGGPSDIQLAYDRLQQDLEAKHGVLGAASIMNSLLKVSRNSGFEEDDVLSAGEIDKVRKLLLEKDFTPTELDIILKQAKESQSEKKPTSRATIDEMFDILDKKRDEIFGGGGGLGDGLGGGAVKAETRAQKGAKFGSEDGTVAISGGLTAATKVDSEKSVSITLFLRGEEIPITGVGVKVLARSPIDEDEQPVAEASASHIEFSVSVLKDHFANLTKFNLGTVEVDGKTRLLTSYKIPKDLKMPNKVPLKGAKAIDPANK